MKPQIYAIIGINTGQLTMPHPLICYEVNEGKKRCEGCGHVCYRIAKRIGLNGFDYLNAIKPDQKAFLSNDDYLIAPEKYALSVVNSLSGTSLAEIYYSDWEQCEIPTEQQATIGPRLGAIDVVGRCSNGLFAIDGRELHKDCESCGNMRFIRANNVGIDEIELDYNAWDGSDLFRFSYGTNSIRIITDLGRKKLLTLGFENLQYQEIHWS